MAVTVLSISRISDVVGALVEGVDASQPPDGETAAALREALWRHQVLVLRGQRLEPGSYLRFAGALGEVEPFFLEQYHHPEHPGIYVLSNVARGGKAKGRSGAGTHWHTDHTFLAAPASVTLLYALEVPPEGGDTLFVDGYAAYESLPGATRERVVDLLAVHRYQTKEHVYSAEAAGSRPRGVADEVGEARIPASQARRVPEVRHPVARVHPVTGRRALYLNEGMMVGIDGMATDAARTLLRDLCAQATASDRIYRHRWEPGDLLLWDNASVLHSATYTDPKHARTLHRITLAGGPTH